MGINDWGMVDDPLLSPPLGGTGGWADSVAAALDRKDATVDSRIAAAPFLRYGPRNRIINGDFSVNQRSAVSLNTNLAFGFDRWYLGTSGGNTTYECRTAAYGELPESAWGYARLTTTGHSAASSFATLSQRIEYVSILSGKAVTVSFWAKAAVGTPKVAIGLVQEFGPGGSTVVSVAAGQVTLSTTWQRYSVSAALPSVAGKTIMANNHLVLDIWVSAGSAWSTWTGGLPPQNNVFDIWGVQVEEGGVATPFEQRTYAQELQACRRYYCRILATSNSLLTTGFGSTSTTILFGWTYGIPMRAAPVFSCNNPADWGYSAMTIEGTGPEATRIKATSTGVTIGRAYGLGPGAVNSWIAFDAEL